MEGEKFIPLSEAKEMRPSGRIGKSYSGSHFDQQAVISEQRSVRAPQSFLPYLPRYLSFSVILMVP